MTTEEWRQLPMWVKIAIIDSGYGASQIGEVRFDPEAKPLPTIEVALRPTLPKDIEFTVVVEPGG